MPNVSRANPYLEALGGKVVPGFDVPLSSPVFPMASDPRVNLRTQLTRMIAQAGLPVGLSCL